MEQKSLVLNEEEPQHATWADRVPAIVVYAIPLIVVFSVVLLAYWPGILVSDSMYQWNMAQTGEINNWHPAYNTIYIMLLSKICNSPAFVLFVQSLILSFSIAFFLATIERQYGVNRIYLFVCAFLLALIPLNYNAAVLLLKDTIYAALSVVLCGLTLRIVKDESFFDSWKWPAFWAFVMLALCLTRHNGILAVLAYGLVVCIVYRKRAFAWIGLAAPIVVYVLMTTVGFQLLGVAEGNYMNKYAPASHVLARMLNTDDSAFSDEELQELSQYVDLEALADSFSPINMDLSIAAQDENALKESGDRYLGLVLEKAVQNPALVLEHYAILDSYLFSPLPFEGTACVGTFYETDLWEYADEYPELNESSKIPALLKPLKKATKLFQGPGLEVITLRPAWYLYFAIAFAVAISIKYGKKKLFLVSLVPIATTLSLAPAMPVPMVRYAYPIILIGYLLVVWAGYEVFDSVRCARSRQGRARHAA